MLKDCRGYGYKDQIQRAAVSILNNIAEEFERRSDKELKQFLFVAKGSAGKVRPMLYIGQEFKYISQQEFQKRLWAVPRDCRAFIRTNKNFINFMKLYIDTADFNQVTFALGEGKKLRKKVYQVHALKSHETLGKLKNFLGKGRPELKAIYVNKGPGSYTGVRVGIVMAQALGLAWGVKVVPKTAPQMQKLLK